MKQALHIKNLTKKYKEKSKKRLPSSLTTLITVRI